jgi:hypothetical protein
MDSAFSVSAIGRSNGCFFSDGSSCRLPPRLWGARARIAGPGSVLVGGGRVRSANEVNAWLVDVDGRILKSFAFGDGIEDFFRAEDFLVVSYFDEGVYGETPQGREGLAVFDLDGRFLWGWNDAIASLSIEEIDDCYSAAPIGNGLVAVFSYTAFQLGLLDLTTRSAVVYSTPTALHGARLSLKGERGFFCGPFNARDAVLSWHPTDDGPTIVGEWKRPSAMRVRGLPGARFLGITQTHVEMIAVS